MTSRHDWLSNHARLDSGTVPSRENPAPGLSERPIEQWNIFRSNGHYAPPADTAQAVISKFAGHFGQDYAIEMFGRQQFEKALASGQAYSRATSGENLPVPRGPEDPKSLFVDPFATAMQLGYRERPRLIPDHGIEILAAKTWPVTAIVKTRINQIADYTTPQRNKFNRGYRIRLRDVDKVPTRIERQEMKRLEDTIWNSGSTQNNRPRPNFADMSRALWRDSLLFDAMALEIIPNRRGEPVEWLPVDAKSIRIAETGATYPLDEPGRTLFAQVYDGIICQTYTSDELAYGIRNPKTDIRWLGYGTPEIEECITAITSLLSALTYNRNAFSQGIMQKGLLNLKGPMTEDQLRLFRAEWYSLLGGVENAFRTPVTNLDDVEFVPLSASNRDMEFSAYVDFLIKVVCGCYLMDPVEINFKFGNQAGRSMFEGAQKAKSQESRQKGLKPLLMHYANFLNRNIVWRIRPEFVLEFTGTGNEMTEKEQQDLIRQRVTSMSTVDEVRAEMDLDPLPNGLGAVLLDPAWMGARRDFLLQKQQEEQQALMQQQEEQMQMGARDALGGHGGPDALESLVAQLGQQATEHQTVTGELPEEMQNDSAKPGKKPASASKTKSKPKASVKKSLKQTSDSSGAVEVLEVRI